MVRYRISTVFDFQASGVAFWTPAGINTGEKYRNDTWSKLSSQTVFTHGSVGFEIVRIAARIDRLASGNPGDVRPVGSGVSELRIDYGPGYRIYFTRYGPVIVVLLCGGDKGNQKRDIEHAKVLAAEWESSSHEQ